MTTNRLLRTFALPTFALLAALSALAPGPRAEACGGLFCNPPDSLFAPPPVAQTAENVLFAMERGVTGQMHLEAHVQIFYAGTADKFSWVVPVDNMPTLAVGANRVFQVLGPATSPSFGVTWRDEGTCRTLGSGGAAGGGGFGAGSGGSGGASATPGTPGVDVTFRGEVGPYDATVLRSTDPSDPKGVKRWLADNNYFLPAAADRIIDQYASESKYFVAIKLIPGKNVNEIQPLVMRFDGPGPCVPLRLTAIASINDLNVNLWVLADKRVVPQNFFEIKVNQARIDWLRGGFNYQDLVKEAANEAGGNAFVTDYVGSPEVASRLLSTDRYSAVRIALAATPPEAMNEINQQGLPRDGTLLELLRKHIPEPAVLKEMGISEQTFYSQLSTFWATFRSAFAPFSAPMLALDVDTKIIQPLVMARALFERFPKLTRLSTYISPDEMNADPLFVANDTLPDVPAARVATAVVMCGQAQYTRCNAPVRLELPDGQKIYFQASGNEYCYGNPSVARGALDTLPALEVAWKRDVSGPGVVRKNNRPAIDAAVAIHNSVGRAARPFEPYPGSTPRVGGGCALVGSAGGGVLLLLAAALGAAARRATRSGRRCQGRDARSRDGA